jgi:hypothetical protein
MPVLAGESRKIPDPAARPARLILILSLAPIIGLGIGLIAGAAGHARHAGGRQGPTAVGAITDVFGNLSCELNASALLLALGAVAAAFQRRLARST